MTTVLYKCIIFLKKVHKKYEKNESEKVWKSILKDENGEKS